MVDQLTRENRPNGTSWLNKLNASDAQALCKNWGLTPKATLELNRGILRELIEAWRVEENLPLETPDVNETHFQFTPNHTTLTNPPTTSKSTNQQQPVKPTTAPATDPISGGSDSAQITTLITQTALEVGRQMAQALTNTLHHNTTQHQSVNTVKIVTDMVQTIQPTSGANSSDIVNFLIQVKKLNQLNLIDFQSLMLILIPKTEGAFKEFWTQQLSSTHTYDTVATLITEAFIHNRVKQQLATENIYRCQRHNESLTDFVTSIQDNIEILQPDMDSPSVLDILITGLNDHTRANMGGFPAPTNVAQLLQLAPKIDVVRAIQGQPSQTLTGNYNQQSTSHRHTNSNADRHYHYNTQPNYRPPFRPRVPNFPFNNQGQRHPSYFNQQHSTSPQNISRHNQPTTLHNSAYRPNYTPIQPSRPPPSRQLNYRGRH